MKKNIILICGGVSSEHQVSLLSASSLLKALNKDKYSIFLVGIDAQNQWWWAKDNVLITHSDDAAQVKLNTDIALRVQLQRKNNKVYLQSYEGEDITDLDLAVLGLHGGQGEDGNMQGYLNVLGLSFTGPDSEASALCMDKDIFKRLCRDAGIPVTPFVTFQKHEDWESQLDDACEMLNFPIFVKPSREGSSVGVNKCKGKEETKKAIIQAFLYDSKVLLEAAVSGREIEISVLGKAGKIEASIAGEIIPQHEFYSYDAKYIDANGAKLAIPAKLSEKEVVEAQNLALDAYILMGCHGYARVDLFLDAEKGFILNEINTLPGFTSISMYPKLWEASGLKYSDLLDQIIQLALEKKR